MSTQTIQAEIIKELSAYTDWMEKYQYLIEQGKTLKSLEQKEKTEEYLIKGCQSRTWLIPKLVDGKITFRGESDALIVKGLLALLLRVANNQTPQELKQCQFSFIDKIGLKEHLSPNRSNGLLALIKQMRLYAIVYDKLTNNRMQDG
jgi:cysteine desulfuration protein SufE